MLDHKASAQDIALLLMQVLGIPHGRTLVAFFGQGYEESNLEAITVWVESNMHEIDPDETFNRLHYAIQAQPPKDRDGAGHGDI